jgi:hypothetical protein
MSIEYVLSTAVLLLLAISGCGNRLPVEPESESWIRATITDDLGTWDLEASSHFFLGDTPSRFGLLSSHGTAEEWQSFFFWRRDDSLPPAGRYHFELPAHGYQRSAAFAGTVGVSTTERAVSYVAESGELVITLSTEERVEGSFDFMGRLLCVRPNRAPWSEGFGVCSPYDVVPSDQFIRVVGSFSAARDRGVAEPLR